MEACATFWFTRIHRKLRERCDWKRCNAYQRENFTSYISYILNSQIIYVIILITFNQHLKILQRIRADKTAINLVPKPKGRNSWNFKFHSSFPSISPKANSTIVVCAAGLKNMKLSVKSFPENETHLNFRSQFWCISFLSSLINTVRRILIGLYF